MSTAVWAGTVLVIAAACNSPRAPDSDWLIVPGERAGAVRPASTEAELVRAYGAAAVRRARIELGEGETAPGTVLFPADSLRRLEVLWRDTVARAAPARLALRGAASRWHLPGGTSLGTTLRELERRNGRAFTLAGFGWDYGGVVIDWEGGTLARELRGVTLYLDPGARQYASPAYRDVLGDRDYRSASPAMQALNPRVYQVYLDFDLPAAN